MCHTSFVPRSRRDSLRSDVPPSVRHLVPRHLVGGPQQCCGREADVHATGCDRQGDTETQRDCETMTLETQRHRDTETPRDRETDTQSEKPTDLSRRCAARCTSRSGRCTMSRRSWRTSRPCCRTQTTPRCRGPSVQRSRRCCLRWRHTQAPRCSDTHAKARMHGSDRDARQ
jgi:hypothetical protein